MGEFSVLDVTVTIGGVDVSEHVISNGDFEITSKITAQIDTATIALRNAGALGVNDWDEIIIYDGVTKIFGGYVLPIEKRRGDDRNLQMTIDAADYAAYLDHVIVTASYANTTDAVILADLFGKHLSALGFTASTYVTEENAHSRVVFNRKTLRQCIEALAEFAGAQWYIDQEKRLHFFTGVEGYADFEIVDSPDYSNNWPLFDLAVTEDPSAIANRVEVVGGDLLSDNVEYFLPGTGQTNRILMPFKMSAASDKTALLVYRNDGTESVPVWIPMQVKAGHLDSIEDDTDVLHYYQERVLEQQDDFPNLPNAVKIYGRFARPVRVRVPSQESYDYYGLWFDEKIVDADISDKVTARKRAQALLADRAFRKTSQTFGVRKSGLYAGQVIRIQNELHNYGARSFSLVTTDGDQLITTDGDALVTQAEYAEFLMHSVTARIGKGGRVEYQVSSGDYIPNLYDLLIKNHRASSPEPLWNENERLDYLLEMDDAVAVGSDVMEVNATGTAYYFSDTPSTAFTFGKAIFRD